MPNEIKLKAGPVANLIPGPMAIELWPTDRPADYPKNARKWSAQAIDKVAASIKEFGFRQPVVVDSEGVIVIGHLRRAGARKLGLAEIPVHVAADLNPQQIRALRIADNRTSEESTWNLEMLSGELLEMAGLGVDLLLTGFDGKQIDGLLIRAGTGISKGLTDDDAVPEVPAAPVSALGDLWLLGDHRVLCGDSTSQDATSRLFGGKQPELCVTDPPYGISIVNVKRGGASNGNVGGGGSGEAMYPFGGVKQGTIGGSRPTTFPGTIGNGKIVQAKQYAAVMNDHSTEAAAAFYRCALAAGIDAFIIFGGNYFTEFLPASACWLVWDKQNNSTDFADVELAWTSFRKGARLYSWLWNGLSRAGDRKTELTTRVHPTQKPVGLFEKIFADFPAASCYDGFLGSGSTLIACEKTGRACFGMELSPAYVDVIVGRWQAYTGKPATLEATGETFADLKDARVVTNSTVPGEPQVSGADNVLNGALEGQVNA